MLCQFGERHNPQLLANPSAAGGSGMTTAKEELEDLVATMQPEAREALKDIPFDKFPIDAFDLGVIINDLPKEVKTRYEGLLNSIRKINTLLRIAGEPKAEPIELTEDLTREITFKDINPTLESSIKK